MNQGVRGRALMKNTRGKISHVSVPLSHFDKKKTFDLYLNKFKHLSSFYHRNLIYIGL
jgi:hypothetical protein